MKFFLFWLMMTLSLPGFSQEGPVTRPEDLEQRVHVLGTPSETPQQVPQQNIQTDKPLEEDEQMLNTLEEERKAQTETAVKLDESTTKVTEAVFNAPEELKKLGHETITAASLMDEKVLKVIKKMLEQSTLKNASNEEVRVMILDRAKGSPLEGYLNNHPKVVQTFVEIMKDEKAMSSLVGIFLRRSDLKLYACFWLVLMIIAWAIKKYVIRKKKKWSSAQRFVMSFLVSICVTATSFTIFYNMFHDEISPTAKIIVKNWRRRNLKI